MEISIGIMFAGLIATTLVQWLKNRWQLGEYATLGLVAGLSFVGALIYTALQWFGFWEAFLGILVIAGAIYTFLFARLEGKVDLPMFK